MGSQEHKRPEMKMPPRRRDARDCPPQLPLKAARTNTLAAIQRTKRPAAPAVYRPQVTPKVLQTKSVPRELVSKLELKTPKAPPVYRPPGRIVSAKPADAKARAPRGIAAVMSRARQTGTASFSSPLAAKPEASRLLQLKSTLASPLKIVQQKFMSPQQGPTARRLGVSRKGVIQRSSPSPSGPSTVTVTPAEDPFPALGAPVSRDRLERIRQESLTALRLQNERDEKERIADQARQREIASLDNRQTWWNLLYVTDGSTGSKVHRNRYGTVDGKNVHVTVIKDKTQNPDFRRDTAAQIVDKILGGAVLDSLHVTMEKFGQDDVGNPRYFRNGDHPNCSGNEATDLQTLLAQFVGDATTLAHQKKALL